MKINDFISYDYDGENYVGIVRKKVVDDNRAAYIIELKKHGTCIHDCGSYFKTNKGMWFYPNDGRFRNIKILTKQNYFIRCLK